MNWKSRMTHPSEHLLARLAISPHVTYFSGCSLPKPLFLSRPMSGSIKIAASSRASLWTLQKYLSRDSCFRYSVSLKDDTQGIGCGRKLGVLLCCGVSHPAGSTLESQRSTGSTCQHPPESALLVLSNHSA